MDGVPAPHSLQLTSTVLCDAQTDRLPSGWNDRLNKMDEVWVPTQYVQQQGPMLCGEERTASHI